MRRLGDPTFNKLGIKTVPWGLGRSGGGYFRKILSTAPNNLIAYWPLWEASGTVAEDISGNNRDGTHNNVTLGQPGIGDGRTSAGYDGATSFTNIFTPSFRDAFNGDEGTLFIVGKVSGVGVWTDGVARHYVRIAADATNSIRIIKNSPADRTQFTRVAGGVSKTFNRVENSTEYLFLAITWSVIDDEVIAYDNGVAVGAPLNAIGGFVGAIGLTVTNIGSSNNVPANVFDGDLAHCAVWNRALTPAEITSISSV